MRWWFLGAVACTTTTSPPPPPTGGGTIPPPPTTTDSTAPPPPTTPEPTCPPDTCDAVDLDCLGLVDNDGADVFGLRIAQLTIVRPATFATGILADVLASNVTPDLPQCSLIGAGTFSWLLAYDDATNTLTFGGAKPVTPPTAPWSFVEETISLGLPSWSIAPVAIAGVPLGPHGTFETPLASSVLAPIYLDPAATQLILLPLGSLRLTGTVSADHNCIGTYNAEGLDPVNYCLPDDDDPSFVDGGTLEAVISLEEADEVLIPVLAESLCVLLSGSPTAYGEPSKKDGITRCKRDEYGTILLPGDACTVPDTTCTDALSFSATYTASAVALAL